jgi:RNA polymerase sigma-70 factor (ECF subfamily)
LSASGPATADRSATDLELVAAVLRKDRKATAQFVQMHADAVFSYVSRRLAPRHDLVEDLVQDIFLEAWQALERFRGLSSVRTWILAIARHKVQDFYRERLRAFKAREDDDSNRFSVPAGFDLRQQERSEAARIQAALAALPEPYRLALLWRYWEKVSTAEMAGRTGKTEKAMERLLARAREQFRRCYSA